MVELAGLPAGHITLVERAGCYPKRLAQKIWASFLILVVRCETFLNQEYTMPPASKCLTRSRFLPGEPTYEDIQLQLQLLTLAYAQALQYWVEKVNPPTLDNYCPLVISVVELRWQLGEHFAFSKQDVLCGLEDAIPEARSQNTEASPEDAITLPTTTNIEGVKPQPMTTQGTDNTIPVEPATSSAETNPPAATEVCPKKEVAVPVTKRDSSALRDLMNPWAASPTMAENQIIPTITRADELVPPTPSDQVGGERPCILTVTTSIGRLNLEATGVTPSDTTIASVERMTSGNPCMAASLLGLS